MGWNKKIPPRRMPKTKSAAPLAPTKHTVPCDNFGVRRGGGGGAPPPPLGSGPGQGQPPCSVLSVHLHHYPVNLPFAHGEAHREYPQKGVCNRRSFL